MSIEIPGTVIRKALSNLNASAEDLANALGVYPGEINTILQGGAPITAQMAVRLEVALKQPAEYWMALQAAFDIEMTREKGEVEVQFLKPVEKKPLDGERGQHGLPLWNSVFEICSPIIGDAIVNRDDEVPSDIRQAFKAGRKAGHLSERGNLAYDTTSGKFGFLISRFLKCSNQVNSGDLDALGEYLGVKLACYDSKGEIANLPNIYFTAFIESPEKFTAVPDIFKVMSQVAYKWNIENNRDIQSQIAGAAN